jgi:hypothetical protein
MNKLERTQFDLKMILPYVDFLRHKVDTLPAGNSLCYQGEPLEQHATIFDSQSDIERLARTRKELHIIV